MRLSLRPDGTGRSKETAGAQHQLTAGMHDVLKLHGWF